MKTDVVSFEESLMSFLTEYLGFAPWSGVCFGFDPDGSCGGPPPGPLRAAKQSGLDYIGTERKGNRINPFWCKGYGRARDRWFSKFCACLSVWELGDDGRDRIKGPS